MEKLRENLPLLTVIAVAACICYAVGCFHYIGVQWLSVLSFSDIVVLTWSVLPIVFGAGAFLFYSFEFIPSWFKPAEALESAKRPLRLLTRAVAIFVAVAAYLVSLSFLAPQAEWARVLVLISVMAQVIFVGTLTSEIRMRIAALGAATAFMVFGLCYALGQERGATALLADNNDTVVRGGVRMEVNILLASSAGVLFSIDRTNVEYVRWDDIDSISQRSTCLTSETGLC